ncbi:hypothetical protein D9758_015534 [Tetrapyrgos nigripes]|uniref:Uncharacterized protein n=1 Tax=Tetrapyrgos nigripes TaxID=182062 RepID=A0A8H5C3G5_9AGAR|nr:hypothetical protein D9758_015534 [Tetrapyrgos nigripes]
MPSTKAMMIATGLSVSSPTRALNLKSPVSLTSSSPRSILKRPPPLHLSPSPGQPKHKSKPLSPISFSANVTIIASPTKASPSTLFVSSPPKPEPKPGLTRNRSNKTRNPSLTVTVTSPNDLMPTSPHVHFPPSPNLITATFHTHSSECYDRSAIQVSPNVLEIPSWGARVYSPTIGDFRGDASKAAGTKNGQEEDAEEEDDGLNGRRFGSSTRLGSPFTPPIAGILLGANTTNSPSTPSPTPFSPRPARSTRASLRFQNITALNSLDSLQPLSASAVPSRLNDLRYGGGRSLTPIPSGSTSRTSNLKFPRSPYPSTPTSPITPLSADDSASFHTAETVIVREEDVVPLSALPSAPLTATGSYSRSTLNLQSPSPKDPFAGLPSFSLVLSDSGQQ